jgi:hypothetical protein
LATLKEINSGDTQFFRFSFSTFNTSAYSTVPEPEVIRSDFKNQKTPLAGPNFGKLGGLAYISVFYRPHSIPQLHFNQDYFLNLIPGS